MLNVIINGDCFSVETTVHCAECLGSEVKDLLVGALVGEKFSIEVSVGEGEDVRFGNAQRAYQRSEGCSDSN